MSKNKTLHDDLSAYMDGELAPGRAEQVKRALADDPALSAELDGIRAVRELLAALPRARAPRDLVDSVLHQAERTSLVATPPTVAARRPLRWMRYAAAAALLLVAATLGIMTYPNLWPDAGEPIVHTPPPRNEPDAPGAGPDVGKVAERHGKDAGAGVRIAGTDTVGKDRSPGPGRYGKGTGAGTGRGGGIVKLGALPEADVSEVIYTPTVAHTQRQIETFLARNSIEPVVTASTAPVPPRPAELIRGRGNHFRTFRVTANQVRIRIDAATPEQIERIRGEIEKIRTEQRVSQVAIPGEAIAFHKVLRPAPRPSAGDKPQPKAKPADKAAAPAMPGGGTVEGKFEKDTDPGAGGRRVAKSDSPRKDDPGKSSTGTEPDRAKKYADGEGAGADAKPTDDQTRQRKGKDGPGNTDTLNGPAAPAVAAKETGPVKNAGVTTRDEDGQQHADAETRKPAEGKGGKALAERLDREEMGFVDVLMGIFDGKKARDGQLAAKGGWQSKSRPSRLAAATPPKPDATTGGQGQGQTQAGRQFQRPASQGQQDNVAQSRIAGANVRAMVITLNFRSVTDAQFQRIESRPTNDRASQTNDSK